MATHQSDRSVYETPKRPEPVRVVVQEMIDPYDLMFMREHPADFSRRIKGVMTRKLADYLMEECQVFEMPGPSALERCPVVRMEFTLHDAGTYENWLPSERRAGRDEGRKQTIESLPYGFEPGQFYE